MTDRQDLFVDHPGSLAFWKSYRAELEHRIRSHLDEADVCDDEGAHIGFAQRRRALASGLHEAIHVLDEMWRKDIEEVLRRRSELDAARGHG